MKSKNFTLVVLAAALVGVGLWWFTRSTALAPEEMTEAPMSDQTDAPKQGAPMIITPPITSSTPTPDVVPISSRPVALPTTSVSTQPIAAAPPDPSVDPQADLKTAIPDIARLTRAGNQAELYRTYTQPDQIDPHLLQQIEAQQAQTNNFQTPTWQEIMETEAESYDELEGQAPTLNAAGDEATYMLRRTDAEVPPGTQEPLTFVKINGKWYYKSKSGN